MKDKILNLKKMLADLKLKPDQLEALQNSVNEIAAEAKSLQTLADTKNDSDTLKAAKAKIKELEATIKDAVIVNDELQNKLESKANELKTGKKTITYNKKKYILNTPCFAFDGHKYSAIDAEGHLEITDEVIAEILKIEGQNIFTECK